MNKFYKYLPPVVLLVVAFVISTFTNNQFVLFIGWIISLIWLNRIASKLNHKIIVIISAIVGIVTVAWSAMMILYTLSL
jgi:hypothetical protein